MNSMAVWKSLAVIGTCLIIIGIGAGYVDVATHLRFDFLSDHFDVFLCALLLGVVLAFVGIVGFAKRKTRGRKGGLAALTFAFPWILGAIGYPIDGFNVHGPSALVLLLIIPASILALTLSIMAISTSTR